MPRKITKIGKLNNLFRQDWFYFLTSGGPMPHGRLLLTASVSDHWPDPTDRKNMLLTVLTAPEASFTKDNDPYYERDMIVTSFQGRKLWGKIDYYSRKDNGQEDMDWGSSDPSDPKKTTRVLTIMFPEDY